MSDVVQTPLPAAGPRTRDRAAAPKTRASSLRAPAKTSHKKAQKAQRLIRKSFLCFLCLFVANASCAFLWHSLAARNCHGFFRQWRTSQNFDQKKIGRA